MALFGMSEDEIKKRHEEQDARQHQLDRLEADLRRRIADVQVDEERLNERRESLAAEEAQAKRERFEASQDLARRETDAKNGFIAQKEAALREAFEVRSVEVDARLREAIALKEQVARSLDELAIRNATLAEREIAVTEREQMADAGFPDRLKGALEAVEARESRCRERERQLAQQDVEALAWHRDLEGRAESLRQREEQVARAEAERDAGFAERRHAVDLELRGERQKLADVAEALRAREEAVARAEIERDRGFTDQRLAVDAELLARRQAVEEGLGRVRHQRLAELQSELDAERERRRDELDRALAAERAAASARLEAWRAEVDAERARVDSVQREGARRLSEWQGTLAARETEIDRREEEVRARDQALTARRVAIEAEVEERVRRRKEELDAVEADLAARVGNQEEEVERAVEERRQSFEKREESLRAELGRLRGQLQSIERTQGQFDSLQRQLGGRAAEEVIRDLADKESALQKLRTELAGVTPNMRGELDELRKERDQLNSVVTERNDALRALRLRMQGEDALSLQLQEATDRCRLLETKAASLQSQCDSLAAENRRLGSLHAREADRDARIRDIEAADPGETREFVPMTGDEVDEVAWLKKIERSCIEYGLRFHPRILWAFHTALKTAEWSPLTVLAGVSGTGKSELPRLYSHFGGMVFKSLAVQPNWDSQESMLGFFNSIDNKFDAQPILRLLAHSQKPPKEGGLEDRLVMVLLDEMNLAHAELYFAEFLSKLELRRGCKGNDLPKLEVKLGAGVPPYLLPIGRNVLWTGTMNQDETTKSLSDKVLDRSIVIHFPRPASLERRRELKPLPDAVPLLPRATWQSWWLRKSEFTDEEVAPFKAVIERINDALASMGRALGHRVWQSVEYYMANYPATRAAQLARRAGTGSTEALREAMRTAFEDQLAQKVMPKLRGIDTRGRGMSKCLQPIRTRLFEDGYHDLVADFELSCECGYGQFIWQTVNFLREPGTKEATEPQVAGVSTSDALGFGLATATAGPTPAAEAPPAVVSAAPGATAAAPPDGKQAAPLPPKPNEEARAASEDDEPPANFKPGDPGRVQRWKELNPAKRKKYLVGEPW